MLPPPGPIRGRVSARAHPVDGAEPSTKTRRPIGTGPFDPPRGPPDDAPRNCPTPRPPRRVHADRASGRDRDHRGPDRPPSPRRAVGDGRVKFVKDAISPTSWRALGAI